MVCDHRGINWRTGSIGSRYAVIDLGARGDIRRPNDLRRTRREGCGLHIRDDQARGRRSGRTGVACARYTCAAIQKDRYDNNETDQSVVLQYAANLQR